MSRLTMLIQGFTKDGIYALPCTGAYLSPCGKFFSSKPFTQEQNKHEYEHRKEVKRIKQLIALGIDCKEKVFEELDKIENGKSIIPKRLRAYLINRFQTKSK